jgi:uncharacterized protein (UPF0261 family)
VIGTLDTKGVEYAYFCDRIRGHGVQVVLVDAGVLSEPPYRPDITRQEVAGAAGADVEELAAKRDRGAALEAMGRGAAEIVRHLYEDGKLDGLTGLGGTGGTAIVTCAMRRLPVGVPKLMLSTVASGDTRPYVGASDLAMMYSVVDIAGINRVSAEVMTNAAGAIAGMAQASTPSFVDTRPIVGASMFGVTTPCVTAAIERLEELGYEVLVFHQTGIGGRSMEELMTAGFITAALDVTTTELCDALAGGVWPAGADRLEVAGRLGLPQVVSLGGLDMVNVGPMETLPERFQDRKLYEHSPAMTLARTTADECVELGRMIARKLNAAKGPTALFIPTRGISLIATEGQVFHDPDADRALVESLRKNIDSSRVEIHELELDINASAFAHAMADRLHALHQAWEGRQDARDSPLQVLHRRS